MHSLLLYPLLALLAYLTTTVFFFALDYLLPHPPQILGFIARCLAAYGTLILCAFYGTLSSIALRPFHLHYAYAQYTTAKFFKFLARYTIGVKFHVLDDGEARLSAHRPVVIVGNHQTELDILFLGYIFPTHCSVTAKKSLRNVPVLGWYMSLSGTVYIDRVNRSEALKAFEGAAQAMRELQQSVFLFPEGTRSYSAEPMLLPFKKGAFHLAVQAGVDILPVVAENYSRILNVKARRFNAGTIRIKVLDPIPTKGLTAADVDRLTTETRKKMLVALHQMAADPDTRAVDGVEAKKSS